MKQYVAYMRLYFAEIKFYYAKLNRILHQLKLSLIGTL